MVILALVMALTLVMGSVSIVNAAKPSRAFVNITNDAAGNIQFDYGWRNGPKVYSYFIGIYKPGTGYVWTKEAGGSHTFLDQPLGKATISQTVTNITADGSYDINFFIYKESGGLGEAYGYFSLP